MSSASEMAEFLRLFKMIAPCLQCFCVYVLFLYFVNLVNYNLPLFHIYCCCCC